MKIRPTSDHDRLRLKAATGQAIARAGGGVVLSQGTRVEPPALSKYKAPHEADHFMPIDVACDADMKAGAPIILSAMAATLGYVVTPADRDAGPLTLEMVGEVICESGDVAPVILDALADGRLSPAECAAIERECNEALEALWRVRSAVRGECGK